MEIKETAIIESAGKIIQQYGLKALTLNNLAMEMEVSENLLIDHFKKDKNIYLMLLLGLETELNKLVREIADKNQSPDIELQVLFNRLYVLFRQRPYYLSIIFDDDLTERDEGVNKSFSRIKTIAEDYLSKLINEGKKVKTFKTKQSTKTLVDSILSSFRFFMMDEQLINEKIRELKMLKTLKD